MGVPGWVVLVASPAVTCVMSSGFPGERGLVDGVVGSDLHAAVRGPVILVVVLPVGVMWTTLCVVPAEVTW